MAWGLRVYADLYWVPEGTGGVTVIPTGGLSNEPGYGAGLAAGPYPNAQTIRLQVAEPITGVAGAPPNQAAIQAGLSQAGTDLGAQVTTAVVAQIQNWQLGQP